MTNELNKAELKILEEAFWAEVENRLPFQTKSKLASDLRDRGFLQDDKIVRGTLTVRGYCLTHAGRIVYCASCSDSEEQL